MGPLSGVDSWGLFRWSFQGKNKTFDLINYALVYKGIDDSDWLEDTELLFSWELLIKAQRNCQGAQSILNGYI